MFSHTILCLFLRFCVASRRKLAEREAEERRRREEEESRRAQAAAAAASESHKARESAEPRPPKGATPAEGYVSCDFTLRPLI